MTILAAAAALVLLAAPDAEPWKAACDRVKGVAIPAADRPDEAAKKALGGSSCDSEALYYGIGADADVVAARHCAILEMDAAEGNIFGGETVLMMVYANGNGVDRNIDLAIKFACAVGHAPAENEARIGELLLMATNINLARTDFDLCDHTTSGFMQGHCTAHAARVEGASREGRLRALMSGWSKADTEAFAKLRKAADAWIAVRSQEEVDLSGTGRAAFTIEEATKQKDLFVAFLETLEKNPHRVAGTKADLAKADKALNERYRRIMAVADLEYGTVSKDGIKKTERAWIVYRDAWIAFAKKKHPKVSADAINAALTTNREAMLAEFLPGTE